MVRRWIGTRSVTEELKTGGTDDVVVSGWSVRRRTSLLETRAVQEIRNDAGTTANNQRNN